MEIVDVPIPQGVDNHRALIVNAPRPRSVEGIVEVVQAFLHEDITKRIAEQIVDEFVPHTQGHMVEVEQDLPQELVRQCTMEKMVDVPMPHVVVQHIDEQFLAVPLPKAGPGSSLRL